MRTVGQMIHARREELGLTLQALALRVGCTRSYLSTIENDRRENPPSRDLLTKIELALRLDQGVLVRAGDLQAMPGDVRREMLDLQSRGQLYRRLVDLLREKGLDRAHKSGEFKALVDRLAPDESSEKPRDERDERASGSTPSAANISIASSLPTQVPVINRVAAGYPTEFTDLGYPVRIADEYVSVPDVYDADAFAARVVGDSMSPDYRAGDIVVFSPAVGAFSGGDCFVRLERDAETTFKRVYFEKDSDGREMIRLQPLNSAYPPRSYPREDVAGVYPAVYVVRSVPRPPPAATRPRR